MRKHPKKTFLIVVSIFAIVLIAACRPKSSDGDESATKTPVVKKVPDSDTVGDFIPSSPIVIKNKSYFSATTLDYGAELWPHDGINPPAIVKDTNPGTVDSSEVNALCPIVLRINCIFPRTKGFVVKKSGCMTASVIPL